MANTASSKSGSKRGAHLGAYHWPPGTSGNPTGSSKKARIAAELIKILNEDGKEGAPTTRDICLGVLKEAKDGNVQAFDKIADRVDGKVAQEIEIRKAPRPIILPDNKRGRKRPTNGNGQGNGRKKVNAKRSRT
jgi:hypothetical protein